MVRLLKWSLPSEWAETVITAILRTPGLIFCDFWHKKCLDYSVPKSWDAVDLSDASLHLSVLLLGLLLLLLP